MQQFSIQELRRLLMAGRTLDECENIKDYFFDWVKEHNTTAFKVEYKGKEMANAITDALSYAFKRDIAIRGMRMFAVKNLHLLHGTCVFETRGTATFFYFSDLDRGLLIRGDGKDYWLAAFALVGGSSGFSGSIVGTEN
jgi:hypothetical protein